MNTTADLLVAWHAIAEAHHATDQPHATLSALDAALDRLVGRKLLTVLTVFPDQGLVERTYSNEPERYPPGGIKHIDDTPRLKQVLASAQPFIGRTRDDIVANYPDAETIFATGCASIVNMPVIWQAKVVATVNLLHEAGFYNDAHVPLVRCLAHAALPAFLMRASNPASADAQTHPLKFTKES